MTKARGMLCAVVMSGTALIALLAASTAVQAKPPRHCNPAAAKTIVSNRFVRVFVRKKRVYACLKSRGLTRLLLHHRGHEVFGLAGKWVVWTSGNHPEDFSLLNPPPQPSPVVNEISVRTGAVRYQHRTGNGCGDPAHGPFVNKIVVIGDGAFAYGLTEDCSSAPSGFIEATVVRHHAAKQLAPSLADGGHFARVNTLHVISGKTVGWTEETGAHEHATLY